MGVASSTTTHQTITDTPSSSSIPISLDDLPQLPTPKQLGDDPVWEDLKRLETVLKDPQRCDLDASLIETWMSLSQWLREQGDIVHAQQSDIHRQLDAVAQLATELKESQQMERKQCQRLQASMIEANTLKETVLSMQTRIGQLEKRLRADGSHRTQP